MLKVTFLVLVLASVSENFNISPIFLSLTISNLIPARGKTVNTPEYFIRIYSSLESR